MAISKFVLNGTTLMDVTQDTVTPDTLLQNETALAANGELITGEYIKPSGTITITENGDNIDVSKYEFADVHIEGEDLNRALVEGTISFYSNSTATSFRNHLFAACENLRYISAPNVKTISTACFSDCIALENVYMPNCSNLYAAIFYNCHQLKSIEFNWNNILMLSTNAFAYCYNLSSINLPKVSIIGMGAFASCSALTTMNFPECSIVGASAFGDCINLSTIYFPKLKSISATAFRSCYNLLSLYLLNSELCTLSGKFSATFSSTPLYDYTASTGGVYGSIFVPASLYSSYITATNWASYSSRFVSMTDEEIAALDI